MVGTLVALDNWSYFKMSKDSRPFCGVCKDNRADTYEKIEQPVDYWCATCYLKLMDARERVNVGGN